MEFGPQGRKRLRNKREREKRERDLKGYRHRITEIKREREKARVKNVKRKRKLRNGGKE